MTLGQFAVAVGAPPRWIQNAFQALSLPAQYSVDLARLLSFARMLKVNFGMPLRSAFPLAEDAMSRWPAERYWKLDTGSSAVEATFDLERFQSDFLARLSLARCRYAEKRRGRPPKRRRRGISLARWYGVDLSLLETSLRLSPEERLRRLDDVVEELKGLSVVEK